ESQELADRRSAADPHALPIPPASNLLGEMIWWADLSGSRADETTIWPHGFDPRLALVYID
ncbi:uncharacterized protein METZ01_LOCUS268306, partial [marine metagenome]